MQAAIVCIVPAAEIDWPIMDFMELMGILWAISPNTFLIAAVSILSLAGVPVPCALM